MYIHHKTIKKGQKSNCSDVFCRKGVFKILQNLQEKKKMPDSLFNENVAGFIKKQFYLKENPGHACSCKFCESFKYPYFIQHLWAATSREIQLPLITKIVEHVLNSFIFWQMKIRFSFLQFCFQFLLVGKIHFSIKIPWFE